MNLVTRWRNRAAARMRTRQVLGRLMEVGVVASGVDEEGQPRVVLENGLVFFGLPTDAWLRRLHRKLPETVRRVVEPDGLQAAMDVVIRYDEGGLKSGGPSKQLFYRPQAGDTVVEMGAYQGFYTMRLAQQVGADGLVVAIEPIRANLDLLEKNVAANNLDQVRVVASGVWGTPGELRFSSRVGDMQSASALLDYAKDDSFSVEVDTLDNILASAAVTGVDFMVIQLNGAELEALHGLTRVRPRNLAIAARYPDQNGSLIDRIRSLLEERGYEVELVDESFLYAAFSDNRMD